MNLLPNTPLLLQHIYKLLGITQFFSNDSIYSKIFGRLLCLPLYVYYFYTHVTFSISFYHSNLVIILIGRFIQNMINFTYILISLVFFYKRSDKIRSSLITLHKLNLDKNTNSWNKWMRVILVLLFASNILQFPFFGESFGYAFCSCYTGTVFLFETLFLDDIFSLVLIKFKSINQQIPSLQHIDELDNITHHYCLLVDLTNEIINHFAMNLLLTFLFWFGYFVVTIYFALCFVTLKVVWWRSFFSVSAFILYETQWLFMVINSFSQIQIEAEKIGSHVHEIWNQFTTKGKIDRRIRHLELLSIRLFYIKVELTVNGFFNLDWAFCHLIIAALATYSVILIQFLM
ncbi:gustatory receptor 138 [Tribolium castaneum]|uniref:Gustatory receptor n=1 Tax=Tribolium castaneum TaxID=7070 RepID=D6WIN1_TRICA|nr:gustatory receptor 138 [Tribolium castaneum]